MRINSFAINFIWVGLATMPLVADAYDNPSCEIVKGTFMVHGIQTWSGDANGERDIYFLDVASGGQTRQSGNHFDLQLEASGRSITVTVFDSASVLLLQREFPAYYYCVSGEWVKEDTVNGGGDGCEKKLHAKSKIKISSTGELVFEREEKYELTGFCSKKEINVKKITKFKPRPLTRNSGN